VEGNTTGGDGADEVAADTGVESCWLAAEARSCKSVPLARSDVPGEDWPVEELLECVAEAASDDLERLLLRQFSDKDEA